MGSRDVGLLQNAAVRLNKKYLDSFLALVTIPLHSTRISRVNSFLKLSIYESIATVGEIRVWWRADFQSGSRVLKKVF